MYALFSDDRKLGMILAAMKRWERNTCLRFEPWTASKFGNTAVNLFSAGRCVPVSYQHDLIKKKP